MEPIGSEADRIVYDLFEVIQHRTRVSGNQLAFDDGHVQLDYVSLARRISATAEDVRAISVPPSVIGILGGNSVDWIIGQFAGWHAGNMVVPLPSFFHLSQLRHVVQDAGVTHVLTTAHTVETAKKLGIPFTIIGKRQADFVQPSGSERGQIIYTSGSTGQPKGVLLKSGQIMWSAKILSRVIGASNTDSYLSVLPLSLLLETICATIIPILVGAPVRLEAALAARFLDASGLSLAKAAEVYRPTCMVLVPDLLARWTAALRVSDVRAPDSLRFVAVGGAAVPPGLAQQAWDAGIPVYEGYGLSECGSVVSLNRPGARNGGSVGTAIPGLDVRVDDRGEIVVRGPSVMDRYVHGPSVRGVWRTGDLGELDGGGYLRVYGRIDNLIVMPNGRNVCPEWVESLINTDKHIAYSVVSQLEGTSLTAIVVPNAQHEEWFKNLGSDEIGALIASCCRQMPAYATPAQFMIISSNRLAEFQLLARTGRIRHKATLRAILADCRADRLASGTTSQRVLS